MGGSLPLSELAQALGMPLISVPLANHDDNQHAPNENLRLGHYLQGISTMLSVVHGAECVGMLRAVMRLGATAHHAA